MWVRKRIEISPSDLSRGFWNCFIPGDRQDTCQKIAAVWNAKDVLVCLSVRSGFDLLLGCMDWANDSEIIMSGLTIPDMPRIVQENGYRAVGVDIDLHSMRPDVDAIREQINPRTKAIVVAHLLGGICDMSEVINVAREHNLLVIEDCAQAYVGTGYQGDERADVSMFSFGPIKTNTALAGGVFRVRDSRLLNRMDECHEKWKIQGRLTFAKRTAKYAFVKLLSTRPLCGSFYRIMKLFGGSHDRIASTMARGFAGPGFFDRIRQRPSQPMLKLLHRKLNRFESSTTDRRAALGNRFVEQLGDDGHILGSKMQRPTYWVLPMLVDEPQKLISSLWEAGFDASNNCSLHSIVDDEDSTAAAILRHIVFLPLHPQMPKQEIDRMASVIRDFAPEIPVIVPQKQAHAGRDTGELLPATVTNATSHYSKSSSLVS